MPIIDPGTDIIAEKNKLAPDGAWVWLAQVEMGETEVTYWARNPTAVSFLSVTWNPMPFNVTDINESSDGELTSMKVLVFDRFGVVRPEVKKRDGLTDRQITLHKVPHSLIASPTDGSGKKNYITYIGRVQAVSYPQGRILFEVSGESIVRKGAPRGILTRDFCPYVFKDSVTCMASGNGPFCDKSIDGPAGCIFHDNVINFGGFLGIPEDF